MRDVVSLSKISLDNSTTTILDSILPSISFVRGTHRIVSCDVYDVFSSTPIFPKNALDKTCFSLNPLYRDPKQFDFRLQAKSPCRGKASDGDDIGCRYTDEMLEMYKKAAKIVKSEKW